jgi:hypothetical protein
MAERTTSSRRNETNRDAPAVARTVLAALDALAGAESPRDLPSVELGDVEPVRDRVGTSVAILRERAREMHRAVRDQRVESAAKGDRAVAKARQRATEVKLPKGEPSVVVGRGVDATTGEPARAGLAVTARTTDGTVVARGTTNVLGGFSLTPDGEFEDLRIEVADDDGTARGVSAVQLPAGQPSAKLVTVSGEFTVRGEREPDDTGEKSTGPTDGVDRTKGDKTVKVRKTDRRVLRRRATK